MPKNNILNTMQIWSLQGGVCKLTLHGHEAAVSCLQFDETRIISGALDRLIKIWNITNGEVYLTYFITSTCTLKVDDNLLSLFSYSVSVR